MSQSILLIVLVVLVVTATSSRAQQLQQPNTTLNEFKNASLAAAVVDPDNSPAICTLKPADLAAADLAAVKADCGEWCNRHCCCSFYCCCDVRAT
jgi:hypothetical protein